MENLSIYIVHENFATLLIEVFLLPCYMPQISQKFSFTYFRSRACFIEYVARLGAPPHAATCFKSQLSAPSQLSQPGAWRARFLSLQCPCRLSAQSSAWRLTLSWTAAQPAKPIKIQNKQIIFSCLQKNCLTPLICITVRQWHKLFAKNH